MDKIKDDMIKNDRIQLRVSKTEKEELQRLAMSHGMKLSQFIVWKLLYQNVNENGQS